MRIGLCGASGAGKSTLAAAYAERLGGFFIRSVANTVFDFYGYRQDSVISPNERLFLQKKILDRQVKEYVEYEGWLQRGIIADRTPMDMATYLMEESNARIRRTAAKSYGRIAASVTRRYFDRVVFVPMCIPYEESAKRPPHNPDKIRAYEERLLKLLGDLKVPFDAMPIMTDLKDRLDWLCDLP